MERARQEIRLTRKLTSRHVARIHDLGWHDGRLYMAMEFVPGVTLHAYIRDRGRLEPNEAMELGLQILDGLTSAHDLGIVHRDLKPSNVMITPEGQAVILDFGIARRMDDQRITVDGSMVGTPSYMSPEQIRDSAVGPHSDVYSFGCLMYETLTGQPPFSGDVVALVTKHLNERPAPLATHRAGVPATLERVIMRCLEKDPAERYPDARSARAAIKEALEDSVGSGRPTPTVLISEPDPEARNALARLLESHGLAVRAFDEVYAMVEAAVDAGADAVFLSPARGRISELDAIHILRTFPRTSSVPIVLTSSRQEHRTLAGMVGSNGTFLAKPVTTAKLRGCLDSLGLLPAGS